MPVPRWVMIFLVSAAFAFAVGVALVMLVPSPRPYSVTIAVPPVRPSSSRATPIVEAGERTPIEASAEVVDSVSRTLPASTAPQPSTNARRAVARARIDTDVGATVPASPDASPPARAPDLVPIVADPPARMDDPPAPSRAVEISAQPRTPPSQTSAPSGTPPRTAGSTTRRSTPRRGSVEAEAAREALRDVRPRY